MGSRGGTPLYQVWPRGSADVTMWLPKPNWHSAGLYWLAMVFTPFEFEVQNSSKKIKN